MVVSDLDHTWVGEDAEALGQLQSAVTARRDELVLVYNTGRDLRLFEEIADRVGLIPPDYLVAGVGTSLYSMPDGSLDPEWSDLLRPGWDAGAVDAIARRFPELEPQPRQFEFKRSFYLDPDAARVLRDLETMLQEARVSHRLVYSSWRDLDVVPAPAGKGEAVEFLRRRLTLAYDAVVVCGDSANDLDMLDRPWCSVLVANAHREVLEAAITPPVHRARRPASGGVLEGLRRFGFL